MKKTFSKIGVAFLTFFNAVSLACNKIFRGIAWLGVKIWQGISMFFVKIGSFVDKAYRKTLGCLFVKIKKVYVKISYKVSAGISKIRRKREERKKNHVDSEGMKKVKKVFGYLPNLLSERITYKRKQALWGVVFIIPLLIGFVYFFLFPFINTVVFAFSNVFPTTPNSYTGHVYGAVTEGVGWDNFSFIWNVHATFKETLWKVFISTLLDVLMILIFSLLIAVVLNSKFRGRAFVRAVFFMPVIFNSQAVDIAMSTGIRMTDAMEQSGKDVFSTMFDFAKFLGEANMPITAVNFLSNASQSIFNVISYSGVQILIFLAGIQSVSKQLYEAAKIEGATQYEIFWKITFPMVSPLMLTAGVYTVVDSFLRSDLLKLMKKYASSGDALYTLGLGNLTNDGIYAAMAMLFVLVSLIVVGIVVLAIREMVFYYDE